MLICENNMNTGTYFVHTLSLIYAMKLLVIFGIKIYQKLPRYLTENESEDNGDSENWVAPLYDELYETTKLNLLRSELMRSYAVNRTM